MARSPYDCIINDEGLCLSSGEINRLMMMMNAKGIGRNIPEGYQIVNKAPYFQYC
jgi:hypothetical protein